MSAQRKALIVANDQYEHEGLGQLLAPSADAQALAAVLGDEQIGDFDVRVMRNEPAHVIQAQIEELFSEARPDDLLLLHFSCHGLKNESGELFFASANTRPNRLGSTAVSADFVQRCMRTSRSRSVVLLLDCCYGGAFARGVTVRAAGDVSVLSSFPREQVRSGRGRAVITASSAMEYAFEGDQLADDAGPRPSVFTTALVEGLATGDADRDQDGWVSLDELYDYVFDKVRERNPHQTPSRDVEMQGDLYVARRGRPVSTPGTLAPELRHAVSSPLAGIRAGAVQELAVVLHGEHAGLALAARLALEELARDDSRQVAAAAAAVLRPPEPPRPPSDPASAAAGAAQTPEAATPAAAEAPQTPAPEAVTAPETEAPRAGTPDAGPRPAPAPQAEGPQTAAAAEPRRRPAADLRLRVAGVLAVIEAIVLARVPFEPFTHASDYRLISYAANSEQLFIDAAVVLAAGVCLLVPRISRLVGTGLILGATAVLPSDVALVIAVQRVQQPATPGTGGWLVLSAQLLGLTAAVLAGLALWRGRAVRFEPRALIDAPRRQLAAWLVVLLGVAAAIGYVIQVVRASYVPGLSVYITSQLTVPLIWLTFVAVAIPLTAAAARPRVFGTALAGGWIGAGLGEAAFLTGLTTSVFSYALVALALVLIPFGRSAPPPGRPRAARSGPRRSRR